MKPSKGFGLSACVAILAHGFGTYAASPTDFENKNASANETKTETKPKLTATITYVEKGEPAPFSGDLYPIWDSVRMGLEIDGCQERSAAALEHAQRIHEIELSREIELAQVNHHADLERLDVLAAELDQKNAWYRSSPFVAAVAVASTVAVLVTSALLVQATGEVWR